MGKSTFRRIATADPATASLYLNFVVAGSFFTIGSVLFWPGLPEPHLCETWGALLFLVGSLMYMVGAINDYFHIKKELREGKHAVAVELATPRFGSRSPSTCLEESSPQSSAGQDAAPLRPEEDEEEPTRGRSLTYTGANNDAPPMLNDGQYVDGELSTTACADLNAMNSGERHTVLYKRFIVKCQKLNGLIYAVGGFIFALGSALFFPQATWVPQRLFHGAYLGVVTAKELSITAEVKKLPPRSEDWRTRHMWWWSDEDITIISCKGYIFGALCFLVGTGLFFPGMSEAAIEMGALCFIIGSVAFTVGACMDYWRFERTLLLQLHHTGDEEPADEHSGL